ncbi:flavodoxin [Metaplanococcus flavidus]
MKRVLILYASSTGNTEEIASLLEENINRDEFDIVMKNMEMGEVDAEELLHYDGILFGTYTYDDGDLPFETEVFTDRLAALDLSGKVIGVFGSGDTAYYQFCEAVDVMKEEFKRLNAIVIEESVKVDLYPDEEEELLSIKKLADLFQQNLTESTENKSAG